MHLYPSGPRRATGLPGAGGGVGNQQSKHVRIAHAFLAHQQNYLHLESEISIGKYVANSLRKNFFQLWSRFELPWFQ